MRPALFGLLFALPLIVSFLPGSLAGTLGKYLPGTAGLDILSTAPDPSNLSPWPGLGLFIRHAAAILAVAAWRIRRQEA